MNQNPCRGKTGWNESTTLPGIAVESRLYLDTQQAECDQEYMFESINRMDYEQETIHIIFRHGIF